mmetsp:Transcript_16340/g.35307  ORF Transcript_16340/g.35307 Transcript_16340/m.35307 type:complete len:94 (+) Transcript_16340:1170-1451(+)
MRCGLLLIFNAGHLYTQNDGSATGYHFHMFLMTALDIHLNYLPYGHAWEAALEEPLPEMHEDFALGADCAHGKGNGKWLDFSRGAVVHCLFTM